MITPEERDRFIDEAQHLAALVQSEGWKIIQDEANIRISGLTKKLVWEDDELLKIQLQGNIRSLEFLLMFPRQMVEAAQKATEEKSSKDAPAQ